MDANRGKRCSGIMSYGQNGEEIRSNRTKSAAEGTKSACMSDIRRVRKPEESRGYAENLPGSREERNQVIPLCGTALRKQEGGKRT